MTTPDDRLDAYLWDPAADPDPAVAELERRLAAARFDPAVRPLFTDARPSRRGKARPRPRQRPLPLLAAAAALVLAVAGFSAWRWTWPDGRPWRVTTPSGTVQSLAVGATLRTDAETALVQVARIGTMTVRRNTEVTLRSTGGTRHRLALDRGAVHVRVWAPPFSVGFQTPAGNIHDLGCEFELIADEVSTRVRVTSGWVQLENGLGETLVPAGASSGMVRGASPAVSIYDDASPEFKAAVRRYEASSESTSLASIVAHARERDVLTLLQLMLRDRVAADRLAARAAELHPPNDPADVALARSGNRSAIGRWMSALPLPSAKTGWIWNWRDGFNFSKALR